MGVDHAHTVLKDLAKDECWPQVLPDLLSDATTLLLDALDLMRELGGANDRSDGSYLHLAPLEMMRKIDISTSGRRLSSLPAMLGWRQRSVILSGHGWKPNVGAHSGIHSFVG